MRKAFGNRSSINGWPLLTHATAHSSPGTETLHHRWGLKKARETAAQNAARGGGGGVGGGAGGGEKRPAGAPASKPSTSKSQRRAAENGEGKPNSNQVTQGRYGIRHPQSSTTTTPAVTTTTALYCTCQHRDHHHRHRCPTRPAFTPPFHLSSPTGPQSHCLR